MAIVCDLDGVVWLADAPIPGGAAAIAALRAAGHRVLFVTNNSFAPPAAVEEKLERFGIPARGDVVTSAQAAARLVPEGARALVCGGPGIELALRARGVEVVAAAEVDARPDSVGYVLVGFHRTFDYEELRVAATAVRAGAHLVGTNDDATYPTPAGPIPGGGAILAAVTTGAGVAAQIAGKPYRPIADLVIELLGGEPIAAAVGDRADTDGRFAATLGCPFGLVLSGVTSATDLPVEPAPAFIEADLAAMAARLGAAASA